MANNSILKLQVDDKQYEASLKSAQQGLKALQDALRGSGKSFADVDNQTEQYVRELGKMGAAATSSRGKISEMSSAFVELSRVEKQMTDQERQSPVGKALTQSLEQLKRRTIEAKQELDDLNKELQVGGTGGSDKLSGMLQVFGGNLMTKAAGMAASFASEMGEMVKQGIELAKQGEGIRIAFERLGRGDILDGLREATHGTVTDLELMKAAVKFNDFRLPIEELGTMLAFAQQKAKDTGQSVDYMVDSIVTGLGRKSLMILDNLGLSAAEIKEKMAETGDMTKAVGQIIREQMEKAGDYVETAADRAAQANVSLQNKMEELGRKFGPVQEASNQLWTSMKIGILDIIGGPLATLLNQLTEAGRLKNQLNNMNGEPGSGNTKVQRMVGNLSKASDGNRQGIYDRQVAELYRYINRRENYMKDRQRWVNNQDNEGLRQKLMSEQQAFGTSNVGDIKRQIDAAKIMLADYRQAAKQILNPVKADIDTKGAEQNVESLKVKLIELEAQRKKAIAAGDTDLSKNLSKQISQVKSDIKGLSGTTTTTRTHKTTPQEQAANKIEEAERTYAETLQKSTIRMEVGLDSTLEGKKKELAAQERLFDAYNDAYATYADPRYKKAAQDAADKIKTLAGEVKSMTDTQEATRKAARELEAAQKKLADAHDKLAEAQATGSATAIYQAQQAVNKQRGVVDRMQNGTPESAKPTGFAAMKQTIEAEVKFERMQVDETTLHTILKDAVQKNIDGMDLQLSGLSDQIAEGIDIPDTQWESILDQYNQLRAQIGEKPIEVNLETGQLAKDGEAATESWKKASSAINSASGALSSIENPAAKIMGTIGQAIATIALAYAETLAKDKNSKKNIWAFIATAAAAMVSMATTISSIHSSTGYASGGIVDGRAGGFVGGTAYSGDNVGNVRLSSGELVLNRSQQNNLANALEGGMKQIRIVGQLKGEDIVLMADRYGRRSGLGELAFWK